jgi:hypothetical protein
MKTILTCFLLLLCIPAIHAEKRSVHDQVAAIEAEVHVGTLKPEKAHALLIKLLHTLNMRIAGTWDVDTVAALLQQRDEVRRALQAVNRAELGAR